MTTDAQRDFEREAWNSALESGNENRIAQARSAVTASVLARIMNDDDNYGKAGWTK